jgi:hypothetical protein
MKVYKYWCLFVYLLAGLHEMRAQNVQQAYELNDPRNPDCPCHKLQKQAEEEYARQNMKAGNEEQEQVTHITTAVQSGTARSAYSTKRKKKREGIQDLKFRLEHRKKGIRREKKSLDLCYRW